MSPARGGGVPWRAGEGAGRGGRVDQRGDRRPRGRSPTTGCDRDSLEARVARGGRTAGPSVVFVDLAVRLLSVRRAQAAARHVRRQGRHRRQPRDAGGLRLPPSRSRPRPRRSTRSRPDASDPDSLMAIVLFRVDDRLIHGQVVVGWGRPLGREPDRAGGRPGRGERLGAGSLSHGGDARHRGASS